MTRTNAREIAAHLLYAMEYTGQPADRTLEARLEPDYYRGLAQESEAYAERPGKKQLAYIRAIVCGVTEKQEELNRIIAQYAIGWNLGRISRLARTFLRIALYECLYMEEIPNGVAINEAVKLTKSYDDEAAKFVNGILGAFVRGGCEIPPAPVQEAPECLEEEAPAADAPEAAQNPAAEAAAVAQGAAE